MSKHGICSLCCINSSLHEIGGISYCDFCYMSIINDALSVARGNVPKAGTYAAALNIVSNFLECKEQDFLNYDGGI